MKYFAKVFERLNGEWLGACTFGDSEACEEQAIEADTVEKAAEKAAEFTVSGGYVDAPPADGGLYLRALVQCEDMVAPVGIEVVFRPTFNGFLDDRATDALRGTFRWDMSDAVKGAEDGEPVS